MLPKDFVRFCLTGDRAIDQADASGTLLLDVAKRAWSNEVLSGICIEKDFLPRLYESPEVCGKLNEEGAAATSLKVGTPVAAGAGDHAAGAVGTASFALEPSAPPSALPASFSPPRIVPRSTLAAACTPFVTPFPAAGTLWASRKPLGFLFAGSATLSGLNSAASSNSNRDPYEFLSEEASTAPPGAEGLLWAPYLMGERTPHLDPDARGALIGITPSHHRAHIVRAILEGVPI